MNLINSVIIEGTIGNVDTSLNSMTEFELNYERTYKFSNGETMTEKSCFTVQTIGKLSEVFRHNADVGRGVRVVGRLKQMCYELDGKEHSRNVIVADHIEFKPKGART